MDKIIYRQPGRRVAQQSETLIGSIFNTSVAKAILLAIAIFLFYNIFHSAEITVAKVEILSRARVEVEDLRIKNLELASLLDNMQNVEYLEVEARDRLNFSSKKDTVFVIPENLYPRAQEYMKNVISGREADKNEYGFEVWKNFVVSGI